MAETDAEIKPNVQEVERLFDCKIRDNAHLADIGQTLAAMLPGTAVLITVGPRGMFLFEDDCQPMNFPAKGLSALDVTGEGDTVVSMLALALAVGDNLEESVCIANLAAAIAVSKLGTATVTREELLKAVE